MFSNEEPTIENRENVMVDSLRDSFGGFVPDGPSLVGGNFDLSRSNSNGFNGFSARPTIVEVHHHHHHHENGGVTTTTTTNEVLNQAPNQKTNKINKNNIKRKALTPKPKEEEEVGRNETPLSKKKEEEEEGEEDDEEVSKEKMRKDLISRGMSAEYEPSTKVKPPKKRKGLDFSDVRAFVSLPAPRGYGMVECQIIRKRKLIPGLNKFWFTKYYLYHEKTKTFLLSARRRKKAKRSRYVISLDEKELRRGTGHYFGKVGGNWSGTEFVVFDKGANSKKVKETNSLEVRNQLAACVYHANFLGSKGPRKMKVIIPRIDGTTGQYLRLPENNENTNIISMYKKNNWDDLIILQNSSPAWSDTMKSFVLNFGGRVTVASTKNFQIIDPKRPRRTLMQFGRHSSSKFVLDFRYPFSAFQAFSIALSAFDWKLACE